MRATRFAQFILLGQIAKRGKPDHIHIKEDGGIAAFWNGRLVEIERGCERTIIRRVAP